MARVGARVYNPAGHAGLIDNAIGLISALFAYVETRAALLAVESKAMLLQLAAVIAFALGALIAVVFGYVFVLASLIAGIAHRSGVSWTWIALGAGLRQPYGDTGLFDVHGGWSFRNYTGVNATLRLPALAKPKTQFENG